MKNTEKITQELLLLLLVYLKIQNAADSMRLEELQHWVGTQCTCPTCEDVDTKVETNEKTPSFSQEFKEEWK